MFLVTVLLHLSMPHNYANDLSDNVCVFVVISMFGKIKQRTLLLCHYLMIGNQIPIVSMFVCLISLCSAPASEESFSTEFPILLGNSLLSD